MRTIHRKRTSGIFSAFGVVFTQGFEAILIPFLYFGVMAITYKESSNVFVAAVSSVKELFAIILIFIVYGPRLFLKTMKLFKNKDTMWFIVAEVLGTTFGNILFFLAIVLAGSSYGVILTSLYPVWAIMFSKVFFRTKDNFKTLLGMMIAIISGIAFVLVPVLFEGHKITNTKLIGIIFGGLAGFFWALEAFILKIGMNKNNNINEKEVIIIRCLTVFITTFVFYMPISMLFGNKKSTDAYEVFKDLIINWKYLLIMIVLALNIFIMRIFHTKAINNIGVKLTATIDVNNFLVPIVFSELLQFVPGGIGQTFAHQLINPWLFFLIIPLALSLVFTIYNSNPDDIHELNVHE